MPRLCPALKLTKKHCVSLSRGALAVSEDALMRNRNARLFMCEMRWSETALEAVTRKTLETKTGKAF
ncbi:hypothetical protein NDU88_004564 [Pleurodeles waltl]|uniref:Uncharacterized protein n=1 Tax=Pleurodeles waltl TaxID=8319 RepID=A0AAV7VHF8_PLEWA|nr:hypothetical protein NDU88_004564 [Pleurodeles waltl]